MDSLCTFISSDVDSVLCFPFSSGAGSVSSSCCCFLNDKSSELRTGDFLYPSLDSIKVLTTIFARSSSVAVAQIPPDLIVYSTPTVFKN